MCTAEEGGVTEAIAFLKQVHEAFPYLMHDCLDAHCTYGVVKRVIPENHVRVSGQAILLCPKGGRGMYDVSPLSGISGLPF